MAELTAQQKIEIIVKALDSKRAEDIQTIKIGDLTIIADYFIIANGTSNIHTKSLAEEVEFLEAKDRECDLIFRKQELLEFSICCVPANPFARSSGTKKLEITEVIQA